MKVLFIYNDIDQMNLRDDPLQIGTLSAFIKEHGYEVELLCLQANMLENELLSYIGSIDPDLINFSILTHQWEHAKRYASIIKKGFRVPILCSGPHPSYLPEEVIRDPNINMVCIEESEQALLDVLGRMEW
ncbi:MAG: cobalamin B12-binding domain-containing protein [Pseudomonadota bacterium]